MYHWYIRHIRLIEDLMILIGKGINGIKRDS